MSIYKKDERGEYRQTARWVDAWSRPVAGWCVCEIREYADGAMRVHRGEPLYLHEQTSYEGASALHAIYLASSRALGA